MLNFLVKSAAHLSFRYKNYWSFLKYCPKSAFRQHAGELQYKPLKCKILTLSQISEISIHVHCEKNIFI